MSENFISYARHNIDEDDIASVNRILKSNWLTSGPEVVAFEKELAAYCGAKYAIACSNGTVALHLTALAQKLGPGDLVVTTPNSFLSTANSILYSGADVCFSDVEASTANLDPESLRETLRKKRDLGVKSIYVVHFAGHPAEMEHISEIASEYDLTVVEDASHALGARYSTSSAQQVSVGSCEHSLMTTFSFHAIKHLSLGEGGAVLTNDQSLADRMKVLRDHGRVDNEMVMLGHNFRVTDLQCALGRSQLKKIGLFLKTRNMLAQKYKDLLSKKCSDYVMPLVQKENIEHAYHLFAVRVDFKKIGKSRAEVMRILKKRGVGTQIHYPPIHLQPYYRKRYGNKPGDFSVSENYYAQCLSLPMHTKMTIEDVASVVEALRLLK